MQQRLTDIERTLLSAYHDGELSGADAQRAEELLVGSQPAQAYLRDLRNLNTLSVAAFPAAGATTAAGASAGAKLTSSAIRAAAEKGAVTKGMLAGGWGMAGMATAAVAVVAVAVMTLMPSSKSGEPPLELQQPNTPLAQVATPAVMALDTSSLIVPAMTADELVSFAMNGTLPIDEERQRFICVADSAAANPGLHRELPAMLRQELGTLGPEAIRGLDSIKEVVRTSLLNYSDDRIAIRNDMGELRLSVLQHIESSLSPRLPAETRQRLMVARASIEASTRELDRQAREIDQDARALDEGVRYVLLPEQKITTSASAGTMVRLSPHEFSSPAASRQVVLIGNNSLDELRDRMQTTSVSVVAAGTAPRSMYRQTTVAVSAGAGTPRGRSGSLRVINMLGPRELPALIEDDPNQFYDSLDHIRPPSPPRSNGELFQSNGDEGASFSIDQKDMDRLLNGLQKSIDRADSIMRDVQKRVIKQKKSKAAPCDGCGDSEDSDGGSGGEN
jgi:hypothetical protein